MNRLFQAWTETVYHQAAHDLHRGVHPAPVPDPDMPCGQLTQARLLRQGHHRNKARLRHEMRVINVAWIFASSCNNCTCEASSPARRR
jgi:hypothetical protein